MFGALGAAGRGARMVRPFRGHPPKPDRRRTPPRRPGPLDRIVDAFEAARSGKALKALVTMEGNKDERD